MFRGGVILPSMHRPALINYWYYQLFHNILPAKDANFQNLYSQWQSNNSDTASLQKMWNIIVNPYGQNNRTPDPNVSDPGTLQFIVAFKRSITARPLREDHPNFNGSNPYSMNPVPATIVADTTTGLITLLMGARRYCTRSNERPWDVDTDGDGVPDSIWLDIGLAVRSTADGRKYKPLVAVLCLDMDGRLNLNCARLAGGGKSNHSLRFIRQSGEFGTNYRFAGTAAGLLQLSNTLHRGQGFGPAEINLAPLFA